LSGFGDFARNRIRDALKPTKPVVAETTLGFLASLISIAQI